MMWPSYDMCSADMCQEGRTPLMAATEAGRVDVLRLLLERGADARIKNKVF